jgi:hypothetical protein
MYESVEHGNLIGIGLSGKDMTSTKIKQKNPSHRVSVFAETMLKISGISVELS